MAVNSAAINYNEFFFSFIVFLIAFFRFSSWKVLFYYANHKEDLRLKNLGRKLLEKNRNRKKTLRSKRKDFIDPEKENE